MHNKTLELSPGVAVGTDATIRMNKCSCAVIGGAAQLYIRTPKLGPFAHRTVSGGPEWSAEHTFIDLRR